MFWEHWRLPTDRLNPNPKGKVAFNSASDYVKRFNEKKSIMKRLVLFILIILIGSIGYYYGFYTPSVYNGIDISHHNKVNWLSIKKQNLEFCYIKATEGKSFRDNKCIEHSYNAKNIGLNVGLYHYFRTDVSAKEQFSNFMKMYNLAYSNLIPAIDVEEHGNNYNSEGAVNKLLELISLFKEEFNTAPVIYIGNFSCAKYIPLMLECPLWLRAVTFKNIIPNTTIKQTAIIDNIDRNYCNNINELILKK